MCRKGCRILPLRTETVKLTSADTTAEFFTDLNRMVGRAGIDHYYLISHTAQ